jgi:hypothetical protein
VKADGYFDKQGSGVLDGLVSPEEVVMRGFRTSLGSFI